MKTDEREWTLCGVQASVAAGGALLDSLAGLARITAEELDSAAALDAFSAAMGQVIPHDWVNVAYLEADGQRFHLLGNFLSGPDDTARAHYEASVETDGSPFRHTLRTGEPRLIEDYPNDPLWAQVEPRVRALVDRQGLRSGLGVPLRLRRRTIGALMFASRERGRYGPEHVTIAQRFADQLAPFVENLRLYAIERHQRTQIQALNAIGQTIAASLEVEDVFPVFAAAARELVPHDRVGASLLSDDGTALERLAFAAHDEHQVSWGDRVELRNTALATVIEDEAPIWSSDIQNDPRVEKPHDRRAVQKEGLRGFIAVPLRAKGRAFGILTFGCTQPGQYSETDVRAAQQIADQIAPFLDNVRLYRQVRALAAAEERNRLAREVHDTLAQGLTAIALQLDTAELLLPPGAEATAIVAQARDLTRRALEEARRAVWGLHPTPLENRSLSEALEAEVAAFGRRSGVQASFQVRGEPRAIDAERATALFRIAQEALHNVEKHARAERVRVELEFRDGGSGEGPSLLLRVVDDGRGFDPEHVRPSMDGGFGLAGMRERARLAGGSLEVESSPGWGTRLVVQVPLSSRPRPPAGTEAPAASPPPPAAAPIRVLIVDDHELARAGLRRLVAEEPSVAVVGEAADGEGAIAQALALRPDVILMDLQLPKLSGVQAVRELRARWPEARVLIVTTFAQDEHLFEALKAGARGYLLKDANRAELLQGIRTVHQGGSLVQPVVASRLLDRFGELARERELQDPLTEREREVLALVARGARTREIAAELVVSEKTVKYHLTQIYHKLGVPSRTAAVARAQTLGLLPRDELLLT